MFFYEANKDDYYYYVKSMAFDEKSTVLRVIIKVTEKLVIIRRTNIG